MVDDPAEYGLSSYPVNALGKEYDLCTPHPKYHGLAKRRDTRLERYRALFSAHVEGGLLDGNRAGGNNGMALGND